MCQSESSLRELLAYNPMMLQGIESLNELDDLNFDLIITDQRMPDFSGTEILKYLRNKQHPAKRVLLSAYSDFQDIVDSFNQGDIHRFLSKPISNKALVDCINNLLDNKQSKNPTYSSATEDFSEILTQDPVLMQILEKAKQVASTKSNIYIYGETGTGKKTLATAIHSHSSRTDRPFVILNCATVEEDQADSALSGINRNSETTSKSRGILHRANGGTLFLDGVNHLPIAVQAKLLHILQEKSFTTDNSNKPNHFDARIISSSTTPLRAEVEKGSFKEELFYQLNVVPLQLPPLRDRIQDQGNCINPKR